MNIEIAGRFSSTVDRHSAVLYVTEGGVGIEGSVGPERGVGPEGLSEVS